MDVFQATVGNRSYPPDTGGYQRTHGLSVSFPKHGDTVRRYCCTGPVAAYYVEGEFIDREVQIRSGLLEQRQYSIFHDIPKAVSQLGPPPFLWPAIFKSPAGQSILRDAAKHDIAMADSPYLAAFLAENTDIPTVYSSHNVEYQKYESTSSGPFAQFFTDRLQRVEERAVARTDLTVCTTTADAAVFSEHADSTAVVPNGVGADRVASRPEATDRSTYGIPDSAVVATFLGSDYGPNVEAARWLTGNWDQFGDDFHLLVLGASGDKIDDSAPTVHAPGYVDDLQATLAMADVALNPMFSGGGSNIKLVEYFAAALPVVSTPFGARGFDVADGEHLCLAEREEFFDALETVGTDGQQRERLGTNGHRLAEEQYTWESLSEQVRTRFRELVSPTT